MYTDPNLAPGDEQTVVRPIDEPALPATPEEAAADQAPDLGGDYPTSLGEWGAVQAAGETPQEKAEHDRLSKLFEQNLEDARVAREQQSAFLKQTIERMNKEDPELAQWTQSMPSQQGIYANTMQMAPLFVALTALGGKVTRLNGMAMLGATTGVIQGLNAGAANKYDAAMKEWEANWKRLIEQHRLEQEYYRTMLEA